MANLYEIAAFNVGWAPKFGVMKRIRKNDKITRFEVNLAHLPKSDIVDYGITIDSNHGRHVRGAIWICSDGWSLANTPDYISRESYNTDDFSIQYNKNSSIPLDSLYNRLGSLLFRHIVNLPHAVLAVMRPSDDGFHHNGGKLPLTVHASYGDTPHKMLHLEMYG